MALLVSPTGEAETPVYSKVRINFSGGADLSILLDSGIGLDHFISSPDGIETILNNNDLVRLQSTGLTYRILVEDMRDEIRRRPAADRSDIDAGRALMATDGVEGFELGSMGGFYTFDEVVAELDSMVLLFPAIIAPRTSLGTSHEGRDIWMVKISDNPTLNESGTEPTVYYDALTHAREPGSMMTTLYFMYWLLENYGVDPRATHLVNEREMYFVPVVNPDGYVYNQQTDPNGGGFWRKNRLNSGGGCFGVDLNRNYGFGWGLDSGSSPDPCSDIYRGPAAFSEPETEAIRNFLLANPPAIAFSTHTYADRFLNPYGYIEEAPAYDVYAEFSSNFLAGSAALYGITAEMLGYLSSGTTRDYLHSTGTYAWTPELGTEGFWPPENTIIPTAAENRARFEYIAWVAGAFADLQNVRFASAGAGRNDTLSFSVGVKNRGLMTTAHSVRVDVATAYPHATPLLGSVDYLPIGPQQILYNTDTPFQFVLGDSAGFPDLIPFVLSVQQSGIETARDTIIFTVGNRAFLVADDAEDGPALWQTSGTGQPWDTTFVDSYDGSHSFADSRYGNSDNGTNSFFALSNPVDLSSAVNPAVIFAARWSIEPGADYTRAQVSTNGGSSWVSLPGRYTEIVQGQPSYTGTRHWVVEEIDLSSYSGLEVMFRFHSRTDGSVPGDGFYFDEFRVVEYSDDGGTTDVTAASNMPQRFFLHQNYPNPFNPESEIRFEIPAGGFVTLKVFDQLGREVAMLVEDNLPPGRHTVRWSAAGVSSGVYFYRISTRGFTQTRKLVLLR
jgi:murein tripeptide amidase MpaA